MKNSILVLLVVSILVVACSNERETASGQKFTVIRKGDGKEIDGKKIIVLNYTFKDAKDSVWNDSRVSGVPLIQQKKAIMKTEDRVFEVVNMMTKGDSIVFKISAYDLFNKSFKQPVPPKVDSASMFTFQFGLMDVLDSVQFIKFREDLIAKQNEKIRKQQEEQLGKDTVLIDNFLKEKNIAAKKTKSGIRYVTNKQGTGNTAKDGQTAEVSYAGHLLNGKYFDTNIESIAKAQNMYNQGAQYKPYPVVLGRGSVIPGWEETLKLMRKGDQMTVFIPSTLAYGNRPGRDIPANSVLVFDMEMVGIK
jgi:FKBP-type peptidyl-prolyl cis-trans isomerase FkpA